MRPLIIHMDGEMIPVSEDIDGIQTMVPEKNLFRAVLARAMADLFSNVKQEQDSAYEWIIEENDGLMTFKFVCLALDLCHVTIRKKVLSELANNTKIKYRSRVG